MLRLYIIVEHSVSKEIYPVFYCILLAIELALGHSVYDTDGVTERTLLLVGNKMNAVYELFNRNFNCSRIFRL